MKSHFSLVALKVLSLYLTFDNLILMYLSEDLLRFSLFGDTWASWTWRLNFLLKILKFFVIISLNKFSASFSFSTPSLTLIMHILVHLMVSHTSCRISSLFFIIFLFVSHNETFQKTCLRVCCFAIFFCLIKSTFEAIYEIFQFIHCVPQFQNFCLVYIFMVGKSLLNLSFFVHVLLP